jgi:hypothetical protein
MSVKRLVFIGLLVATGFIHAAETNQVVLPPGLENKGGNFNNEKLQLPGEVQQIYASSLFSSPTQSPILITEIAFRVVDGLSRNYNATIPYVEIQLSTSVRTPAQMSKFWSQNHGADVSTVYAHDDVRLSATGTQVVNPFELRFQLDHPFLFDSRNGGLAMLLKTSGNGEFLGGTVVDAQAYGPLTASSFVAGMDSQTNLAPDGYGIITQFSFVTVPEPSSVALIGMAFGVFLFRQRRN